MTTRVFKPSPQYLTKLRLVWTLIALIILLSGMLFGFLISLDETVGSKAIWTATWITLGLNLLWWLPAMLLSRPYYNSLSYEIQDDEVIVRAGIITRSVKHVPYRTVTNLTVNRGLFDRWFFGLGTLNIQTAGMSGTTGAEETLVGLPNYDEVYTIVATELRRFRGGMAPTTTEVELPPAGSTPELLAGILAELQAIRKALPAEKS